MILHIAFVLQFLVGDHGVLSAAVRPPAEMALNKDFVYVRVEASVQESLLKPDNATINRAVVNIFVCVCVCLSVCLCVCVYVSVWLGVCVVGVCVCVCKGGSKCSGVPTDTRQCNNQPCSGKYLFETSYQGL